MRKSQHRLAVLSALRDDPDFSPLKRAGAASDREMRAFLRWLDQSGVALYLLWRLRATGEFEAMPPRLRIELEGRLERNRRRTNAMLADFRSLSESFLSKGIPHAFLKGFTLVPEFCPALELRHQSDFDLLVSPESLEQARGTILECGYLSEHKMRAGEMLFSSPLHRVPSAHDDIYTPHYQRRVELHAAVWEDLEAVSLDLPSDYLARVRVRRIEGAAFSSLSLEDASVFHLLHAFRHFLSSWTRLSWLWEIHYFLESHSECTGLWIAVRERAGGDPVLRKACGLILSLTNQLFGSPIPRVLSEWCIEGLSDRIRSWVAHFGTRWALSELSGSKLSLLIHSEFVRGPKLWRPLLWRRMFPFAGRPSLGEIGPSGAAGLRLRLAQRLFQIRRLVYHGGTLFSLPIEALSWKVSLNHAARHTRWAAGKGPSQTSLTDQSQV